MSHQLNSHFFSIWRGGSVRGVEQSKKKVILFPIFSLVKLFFSHINHPADTVLRCLAVAPLQIGIRDVNQRTCWEVSFDI